MLTALPAVVLDPVSDTIAQLNGNIRGILIIDTGLYEIGHFSFMSMLPFHIPRDSTYEVEYPSLGNLNPFGVSDDVEQVLEYYKAYIEDPSRYFMISFTKIEKSKQSETGGWRWHKWGPYIGNQNPQHEYLYDEPDIELVYVFHIYEVTGYVFPTVKSC